MIHLLSFREKQELLRSFRANLLPFFCAGLGVVFLFGIVLLLPAYFVIRNEIERTEIDSAQIEIRNKNTKGTTIEKEAKMLVSRLALLSESVAEAPPPASVLVKKLADLAKNGIVLSTIAYDRSVNADVAKGAHLSLVGVAKDRAALISFERALKEDSWFSDVHFPISNLLSPEKPSFTATAVLLPLKL